MSLSSLAMCAIFFGQPPVAVFSVVALTEFLGDIIGEMLTSLPPELMPDPHDFQERLGLLFMIVLGETMVGVLFEAYNTSRKQRTYATVM
jgi:low temperature requirement protein LtrA